MHIAALQLRGRQCDVALVEALSQVVRENEAIRVIWPGLMILIAIIRLTTRFIGIIGISC